MALPFANLEEERRLAVSAHWLPSLRAPHSLGDHPDSSTNRGWWLAPLEGFVIPQKGDIVANSGLNAYGGDEIGWCLALQEVPRDPEVDGSVR